MLQELKTGDLHPLPAQTLVGRGPAATIRIRSRRVSAEHAAIRWTGEGWTLRDLGSRNGTFLDGAPLKKGVTRPLAAGAAVGFGSAEPAWRLVDAGPPEVLARSESRVVRGADGVLLLPSPQDPQVVVMEDPEEGWLAEWDGGSRAVVSGGLLEVAGRAWQLWLPDALPGTQDAGDLMVDLDRVRLHFGVSRDEEFVQITVQTPDGQAVELAPRSYHYLLLTLARLRQKEADEPEAERGWVHREDLARMLRVEPRTLTVHFCRIRQQLGRAGVLGAAGLVELRPSVRQVRLGDVPVTIERLA